MEEEKKKEQKINFRYNLKTYWGLMRNYKLMIFGTMFFLLLVSMIDVGVNFLFKTFVDKATLFSVGTLSKSAFILSLKILVIIYAVVMIFRAASSWLYNHLLNLFEVKSIYDLKKKYFYHIIGLSHNFYTTHKTGSLISRLSRGGSAMERMSDVIVYNVLPLIFQLIVTFSSLLYFNSISALIIAGTVIIFITWSFIIQRLQEPANLAANNAEDIEKGNIADIFTNIDSIKYFGKEDYIKKKFLDLAEKTKRAFLKNWSYYKIMSAGQIIILALGTFLLIYSTLPLLFAGTLSIGTIVFMYTVYGGLLGSLYGFVFGLRGFYRSMADFQDLFEYGKIESEIKDKNNAKEHRVKEGTINFENITFDYGKRRIFENFDLKIKSGEKVALVGHSGSGKSTLIKLLYRLYDVNEGSILVDGIDIKDFKQESLRSEMAVVPQECVLFDDTVYNNIAFSNPRASREQVLKAIKLAQLDKIIEKFPKKENTIVGERGVKLSGGEKQRVSIARALLADKRILVLDEATSSLDSETEHEIQDSLKQLMKGRTSIIIAHRLSTIMTADKIIVMKNGKIVQTGKHEQLIREDGEYKHLWNLQKGGYIK